MYEWVNGPFDTRGFERKYPDDANLASVFEVARRIANGTKHFKARAKKDKRVQTKVQSGFSSAFSDGFARPLNVTVLNGTQRSADKLLRRMVEFWRHQESLGAF